MSCLEATKSDMEGRCIHSCWPPIFGKFSRQLRAAKQFRVSPLYKALKDLGPGNLKQHLLPCKPANSLKYVSEAILQVLLKWGKSSKLVRSYHLSLQAGPCGFVLTVLAQSEADPPVSVALPLQEETQA